MYIYVNYAPLFEIGETEEARERERVRAEAEGRESKLCLRMSVIHLVDGVFAFGKTMHIWGSEKAKKRFTYMHTSEPNVYLLLKM